MQVAQRIRGAVSSKQYGFEDLLCPLIAQACIDVCPKNPNNFNVDNVRVIKITGSGAYNSSVVKGIVIKRDTEGTVKGVTDAKVAVFAQGVDTSSTETKVWFGSHWFCPWKHSNSKRATPNCIQFSWYYWNVAVDAACEVRLLATCQLTPANVQQQSHCNSWGSTGAVHPIIQGHSLADSPDLMPLQGTVLIKNAEELQSYSQGEEDRMEQVIKGIADS